MFLGEITQPALEEVVHGQQADEPVWIVAGDHRGAGDRVLGESRRHGPQGVVGVHDHDVADHEVVDMPGRRGSAQEGLAGDDTGQPVLVVEHGVEPL
jgi:hypothetical protein